MGLLDKVADWMTGKDALRWTLVTPRKPGWYWVERATGVIEIVKLVRLRDGQLVDQRDFGPLHEMDVNWWCGPIAMPESRLTNNKKTR